jgi:hypothetical protein
MASWSLNLLNNMNTPHPYYCFQRRANETPSSLQVWCVARLHHCTQQFWTGGCWANNSCHAKRYSTASAARMVATKKDGILVRYYDDLSGNSTLRFA